MMVPISPTLQLSVLARHVRFPHPSQKIITIPNHIIFITSAKKFNVVLDTGSSDLFLSSTVCTKGCEEAVVYNPANSRTAQVEGKLINITLGSIKVTGELASDLVLLGGFRVNPQTFGSSWRTHVLFPYH